MERSSSTPVHQWNGDKSHDHHYSSNPDGCVLGIRLTESSGNEQVGGIIKYSVNPRQLLRQLHHNGDGEGHAERG